MSGYDAGEAFIRVTPNFDNFVSRIIAECRRAGVESGRAFSTSFNEEVRRTTNAPVGPSQDRSRRQGVASAGSFAEGFRARIQGALRALPDIEINADTGDAEAKVAILRQQLLDLSRKTVGVDIDADAARAQLKQIEAELRAVGSESANVQVRVDTGEASAELARFEAQVAAAKKAANFDAAQHSSVGLLGALLPLAPALVPVAGAALAAGGALVAMGVSGALAIKGVQDQIKQGTDLGAKYGGTLSLGKATLGSASTTAAEGLYDGLDQSITKVSAKLPQFNGLLRQSATQLGDIGSHLVGGLVGGFATFAPLIENVEGVADKLATRFEAWATGDGGANFASALAHDFGEVLPVLQSLATLAGHLIASLDAPGGAGLEFIQLFADDLNMIPLPLLKAATTAYIAFRTAVAVTSGLRAAQAALEGFAVAETAAAAATSAAAGAGAAGAAEGALVGRLRGVAGGMAAVVSRAIPYVAAYAAVTFATASASKAFDGFNQTLDTSRAYWGGVVTGAKDLLTLNWGKLNGDLSAYSRAQEMRVERQGSQDAIDRTSTSGLTGIIARGGLSAGYSSDPHAADEARILAQANNSQSKLTVMATETQRKLFAAQKTLSQAQDDYNTYRDSRRGKELNDAKNRVAELNERYYNIEGASSLLGRINAATQRQQSAITSSANAYSRPVARQDKAALQTGLANTTQLSKSNEFLDAYQKNVQKAADAEGKWTKVTDENVVSIRGHKFEMEAFGKAMAQANGDSVRAQGILLGHLQAQRADTAAVQQAQQAQATINFAIGEAQTKYKLTSDQVDLYASALGITARRLADGSVTTAQFVAAVGQVKDVVDNGSTATQGWVAAIAAFNQAGDNLASRAALMGQAMVALQGDSLGYANTMVQAATANQQLVTDWGDLKSGVVNLKTGFIDYHNAGAAPVLNDLQQLQTAAMNAATATYQHEKAMGLGKQAAKDAAAVFRNDTYGALVSQAKQLGITGGEAKKLADRYFHWPKNAATKIEQLGGDRVQQTLGAILQDLDALSGGHHADLYLDDGNALQRINDIDYALKQVEGDHSVRVTYYQSNQGSGSRDRGGVAQADGSVLSFYAAGGMRENHVAQIAPAGAWRVWAEPETGGEAYIPLAASKRARSREIAAKTVERLGGAVQFYAGGGEHGGFTGVTGGSGSSSGSSSSSSSTPSRAQSAADKKSAEEAKQKIQEARQALSSFLQAVGLAPNPLRAAETAMLSAAKAAGASAKELKQLRSLGDREISRYNRLQSINAQLGTAPTAPTAYDKLATAKQNYKDLKDAIVAAIKSGFDITRAGVIDNSYGDSVKAGILGSFSLPNVAATQNTSVKSAGVTGVTVTSVTGGSTVRQKDIASQLRKSVTDARAFVAVLKSLAAKGVPQGLLDQLAQAGPDALPQARALLSSGAGLSGIVKDYKSLQSLSGQLEKPPVTFASIYGDARKAASDARKLSSGLRKLAREGLSSALVAQLAQGGIASLPQVEALLTATPAQLRSLNGQVNALGAAAGTLGASSAHDMYQAGIDAAQGLVDGLKAQKKHLEATMRDLADTMSKRLKHDLGIHSPSKVFHGFGVNTGQGLVLGIRQQIPHVQAAVSDLSSVSIASSRMASAAAARSTSYTLPAPTVNVYPQPYQSEAEIGAIAAGKMEFAMQSSGYGL